MKKKLILSTLLIILPNLLSANLIPKNTELIKKTFTLEQQLNFNNILRISKEYKLKNNQTLEKELISICLVESSCGVNLIGDFVKGNDITKSSLGIYQFQVKTRKWLGNLYSYKKEFNKIPFMSDKEIRNKLLRDKEFSTRLARQYLVHLYTTRKNNKYKSISGYNGGMNNKPYYNRVLKWEQILEKSYKL